MEILTSVPIQFVPSRHAPALLAAQCKQTRLSPLHQATSNLSCLGLEKKKGKDSVFFPVLDELGGMWCFVQVSQ